MWNLRMRTQIMLFWQFPRFGICVWENPVVESKCEYFAFSKLVDRSYIGTNEIEDRSEPLHVGDQERRLISARHVRVSCQVILLWWLAIYRSAKLAISMSDLITYVQNELYHCARGFRWTDMYNKKSDFSQLKNSLGGHLRIQGDIMISKCINLSSIWLMFTIRVNWYGHLFYIRCSSKQIIVLSELC